MARDLKFQMMMSEQEAAQLDDYQFANRIRSRAEAIRQLVAFALEMKAKKGGAS